MLHLDVWLRTPSLHIDDMSEMKVSSATFQIAGNQVVFEYGLLVCLPATADVRCDM